MTREDATFIARLDLISLLETYWILKMFIELLHDITSEHGLELGKTNRRE
jgi:hypothetical protein